MEGLGEERAEGVCGGVGWAAGGPCAARRPRLKGGQGIALLTVVGVLAMLLLLVVAIFALARAEVAGSQRGAEVQVAEGLSELATNLVIAQLRRATEVPSLAWATQPGLVRQFGGAGTFERGYKLYSDADMVVDSLEALAADEAKVRGWQGEPERFVDLNAPVLDLSVPLDDPFDPLDDPGLPSVKFPIVDPRAAVGVGAVEGFGFDASFPGAVVAEDERARLPMPVEWIYVLADGSMGTLDGAGRYVGEGQEGPDNPMVGRVAFWTDDETCKLNINTAGEGIYWDTPRAVGLEDRFYARYQPTRNEFQRYPGHPATTALGPVLAPGVDTYPLTPTSLGHFASAEQQFDLAARRAVYQSTLAPLYRHVPRVSPGGSRAGTEVVDPRTSDLSRLIVPDSDRLYATADEFLMRPDRRLPEMPPDSGLRMGVRDTGRRGFFLTASSRGPELTLFNTPRIAMWPVDAEGRPFFHRTAFDNLIRHCATAGRDGARPLTYLFHRRNADSDRDDFHGPGADIARNRALFRYALELTDTVVPGFGGKLSTKLGADHAQLMAQVFDYIRCVNLCDDNHPKLYYVNDDNNNERQTQYTNAWGYSGNVEDINNQNPTAHHWGHGQVVPLRFDSPSGEVRGFGRIWTFSEAALHFVCSADADQGQQGGKQGVWDARAGNPGLDYVGLVPFYSNFPPLSGQAPTFSGRWGADPGHPGYERRHWNRSLPVDGPLDPGQKRVQAMVQLEAFCAAMGYNQIVERMQIRVSGLDSLRFDAVGGSVAPFRSGTHSFNVGGTFGSGWHGRHWGGTAGFRGMAGRSKGNDLLASGFFTIDSEEIRFAGGQVVVELYQGHSPGAGDLVQRIVFAFPGGRFPAPELVTEGTFADPGIGGGGFLSARSDGSCFTFPQYWWCFTWDGIVGDRIEGESVAPPSLPSGFGVKWTNGLFYRRGRLDRFDSNPSYPWTRDNSPEPLPRAPERVHGQMYAPALLRVEDTVRSLVWPSGDMRLASAMREIPAGHFQPYGDYASSSPGKRLQHLLYHNPAGPHWTPGFGNDEPARQLVEGAEYHFAKLPDFPGVVRQDTGDFDNGISVIADGAFINRPDEGNTHGLEGGRLPYLDGHWVVSALRPAYFSPNRIMPGPGMLGSLPVGVKRGIPWQTPLFRRQDGHPGAANPPDHLLLDLFWMPVVEPWAVSEPFSTAGKINMNYRLMPFGSAIERSTALRGALRAERVTAIPTAHADRYKNWDHEHPDYFVADIPGRYRYRIAEDETLAQFEERFDAGEYFRSASEICDIYLVPEHPDRPTAASMEAFWRRHAITGDNTRERPYTNLHPRLTTKSNTYRVHYRAQSIRRPRSAVSGVVAAGEVTVEAEVRGSVLLERFVDPADPAIPDYTEGLGGAGTLDQHYQFRVLGRERL
jgi:hypothetical protein